MPYITPEDRSDYDQYLDQLIQRITFMKNVFSKDSMVGELNYILTKIVHGYLKSTDGRYKDYNDVIGVLECCKQELYRRHVAPYEDKAIEKNGDV